MSAEGVARAFHEAYEELAPSHGYETREASAKPWVEVPEANRSLMVAVVERLLADGRIVEPTVEVELRVGQPAVRPGDHVGRTGQLWRQEPRGCWHLATTSLAVDECERHCGSTFEWAEELDGPLHVVGVPS